MMAPGMRPKRIARRKGRPGTEVAKSITQVFSPLSPKYHPIYVLLCLCGKDGEQNAIVRALQYIKQAHQVSLASPHIPADIASDLRLSLAFLHGRLQTLPTVYNLSKSTT